MSIIRPDFFKVLPADLVRFGGDGAAFLALVRYAASIDGTDRITVDGVLWWRASHSDIGASLGGLSHDRVQRLASKLQAADKLLIYSPKTDADRTRAYRVPDQSLRESALGVASHYADSRNHDAKSRNHDANPRQPRRDIASCTTYIEQVEGVEACARAGEPTAQPDSRPPQEPPPKTCKQHPNWDDWPCMACKSDKHAYQAWLQASRRLLADLDQMADTTHRHQATQIREERRTRIAVFQRLREPWK